ncbi:MAG: hypothetical protein RLY97_1546 [Pseudomonadota bacterium]|jgi:hypothetical protein
MIDGALAFVIRGMVMRKILVSALAVVSMALSGCAAIRSDLHHTAGYTGSLLDRRLFDASGDKKLVVMRSAMVVAMLARAGTVNSHGSKGDEAYAQAVIAAADEINILAGYAMPSTNPTTAKKFACDLKVAVADRVNCLTYEVNFESDIPNMERQVFYLAVMALPQQQAKKFLDSLKGGQVLPAAWGAAKLVFAAADGLHSAAAVRRSALEIQAHQLVGGCGAMDSKPTVSAAFDCLGMDPSKMFQAPDAAHEMAVTDDSAAFDAIMSNIRESCMMVPVNVEGVSKDDAEKLTVKQVKDKRIGDCAAIKFAPKARFDG